MGYLFAVLGSAVSAMSPHSLLPTPSSLTVKATRGEEKVGILYRYSSAIAETANLTTLFHSVIQSTAS